MENSDFSIDVIIPVFNGQKFIIDAIRSVENQVYKPNKIIIVDDGSTDQSYEIVQNYIYNKNNCIHLIKKNGGPNSARNLGLEHVKANYVAFLDADDIWEEDKLSKQIEIFKNEKSNKLGVVYTDFAFHDLNLNLLNIETTKLKYVRGNIRKYLYFGNFVLGSASSVLIKTDVFKVSGKFLEKLHCSEDWEMWFRISKYFNFNCCKEKLVKIRISEASNSKNEEKFIQGLFYMINEFLKEKQNKTAKKAIIYNLLVNFYSLIRNSKNKIKTIKNFFSKFDKNLLIFIFLNLNILFKYITKCFLRVLKIGKFNERKY
ncbi:glycosyltransferase family 2 protein [Pigmentibacter ruber]